MYEDREGEFAYSIRRRSYRSGKVVWRWEVRHVPSDYFMEGGTSLQSHDSAKGAALELIHQNRMAGRPSAP